MDVNELASLSAVLAFIGAIFSFAVLRPLNRSITSLQKCIDKLEAKLDKEREEREAIEKKLILIEQTLKRLHERMDEYGKSIGVFCGFCQKTHEKDAPMPDDIYHAIMHGSDRRNSGGERHEYG